MDTRRYASMLQSVARARLQAARDSRDARAAAQRAASSGLQRMSLARSTALHLFPERRKREGEQRRQRSFRLNSFQSSRRIEKERTARSIKAFKVQFSRLNVPGVESEPRPPTLRHQRRRQAYAAYRACEGRRSPVAWCASEGAPGAPPVAACFQPAPLRSAQLCFADIFTLSASTAILSIYSK